MKYDEIVSHLGDFGPYQRRIYFLLSLPIVCSAWALLVQVFLAGESDHWCAESDWRDSPCPSAWNVTDAECEHVKRASSIPVQSDGTYKSCVKYNVTGMTFDLSDPDVKNETMPCDEGWIYDKSLYKSTIIMDVSFTHH